MPMSSEKITQFVRVAGFTLIGVGTLIIGKRYYDGWKFQSLVKETATEINHMYKNSFTIDRLIDSDCDGKALIIGINGKINPNNILSRQGIRLGQDGKIKRLVSFIKADNGLVYNFEDNICLTLRKNDKNKIVYSFEMPGKTIVKEMDDKVLGMYKTIGVASTELDKIVELKESKPQLQ